MSDEKDDEYHYRLLVEFPDQSPSFALGFAAGQIYERIKRGDVIDEPVMDENVELFAQLATRKGYSAKFSALSDGWVQMQAKPL